jgi:hypothetical protein
MESIVCELYHEILIEVGMKLYKLFKYTWLASISLIGLMACHPDPEIAKTEKYISASDNFKVKSFSLNLPDNQTIDFTKDSLKFTSEFNEEVSWTITLTGLSHPTDHAVRTIKGTSATLDSKKVFWDGSSDNIYFFKPNEAIDIKVTFLGSDSTISNSTFKIGKTKKFHKRAGNTVVLDFEKTGADALVTSPGNVFSFFDEDTKSEYRDSLAFVGNETLANKNGKPLPTPIQGNGLIYLRGQDIVGEPSSFFVGGFNAADTDFKLDKNKSLDDIYFNFYANSNGNKTTKVVVLLNGIGGDQFKIERVITWTGWKLVSAKLSDFIQSTAGALGTGKISPSSLKRFNIEIHSGDGPGKEVEVAVDFICFTYGGPFNQAK